jgi:hypothetical protein
MGEQYKKPIAPVVPNVLQPTQQEKLVYDNMQ